MSEEEDADVDSGWDLGESEAETSDSSRLLSHAKKLLATPVHTEDSATISSKPTDPPPPLDPLASTRELPIGRGAADQDSDAPVTRRATDEEMRYATQRARPSPDSLKARVGTRPPAIRLGGGRSTTPKADAAVREEHDARVHNRPTPPSFVHQGAFPPAPLPSGAHTSLRFPTTSLKDSRARRPTTKINLNMAELLGAETRSRSPEEGFGEIDLEGNDSRPPRAPVSGRPLHGDPLEDLPVDAAIESARQTMPPPTHRSDAPPSKKTPLAVPAAVMPGKPKLSLAERMAGVVDQLTRGEASQQGHPSAPPNPSPPKPKGLMRSAAPTKPGAEPVTPAATPVPATRPAGLKSGTAPAAVVKPPPPGPFPTRAQATAREGSQGSSSVEELGSLDDLEAIDGPGIAIHGGGMLSLDEPGALSVGGDSRPPVEDGLSDAPPAAPEDPALVPIAQRFERGDYLGALLRAEALLETRPDCEPARRYLESAQELLKQMYLEKLGSGDRVLRLAMSPNEIQGLAFDHRAGFLISLIDGVATVDEILDMSGMPQLDALRLLYEMREEGVVDSPSRS